MSYLNLMGNKLKPKEVNDALNEVNDALNELSKNVSTNDVVANPTGDTSATLNKLEVDGVKYLIDYPKVVNVLDSTSTTDALSAGQGKVLNESISGKVGGWNYLGEQTGTNEQNLPNGWKELLVQVNTTSANLVTYHIYNSQTDSYINTSFGTYGTSYAVGQISRTKAKISTVNWAGSDVTSSSKLYTYYR